jgi:hypothetical protein
VHFTWPDVLDGSDAAIGLATSGDARRFLLKNGVH